MRNVVPRHATRETGEAAPRPARPRTRAAGPAEAVRAAGPRSSDRVLQLLIAVGESAPTGRTLGELAAAVDLVPSTALRQLRSLIAAGLVVHDADDLRYGVGPKLRGIAGVVMRTTSISELARPWLDRLAAATGESCYLAVHDHDRGHDGDHPGGHRGGRDAAVTVTYVAGAPGIHALRHTGWIGRSFAGDGTAAAAALAGRVGARGVVVRHDALEVGITAVAAPVRDATAIVAAVNLVGPSFRLGLGVRARVSDAVAEAAAGLSGELGALPRR